MKDKIIGHSLAFFTAIMWGATYVATKLLLSDGISSSEILFYRFLVGAIILFLCYPKIFKWQGIKVEGLFILAGLTGATIYQYLENIALNYTAASNAAIIIALAPIITTILSYIFLKDEKFDYRVIVGFVISLFCIVLISLNGVLNLKITPLGDLLSLICAFLWSIYSLIIKKLMVIISIRFILQEEQCFMQFCL